MGLQHISLKIALLTLESFSLRLSINSVLFFYHFDFPFSFYNKIFLTSKFFAILINSSYALSFDLLPLSAYSYPAYL